MPAQGQACGALEAQPRTLRSPSCAELDFPRDLNGQTLHDGKRPDKS